ncbi:MAG: zeta toxin family protein [Pirellulaceae bacterium]
MSRTRRIIIIAGPNGAGKTTFAKAFLPHEGECVNFINADLIAAGLSPFKPETAAVQAGRLMLAEMRRYVTLGESFAFETTLSGRSYARQIVAWQAAGYSVDLIFLKLRSVKLALARVTARVAQGGHHVPANVIRRRFRQGWQNFETLYRPLVNHWELYDNSENSPILIEQGDNP